MKLTKQTIEDLAIPAGKAEMFVWDEAMPCFGLRIRAGGKRTWVVQYRLGKKQRRVTIGTVERLDPDQARKRAKTALAKVHLGTDAQVEKSEARAQASVTFASVAQDYLKRYAAPRLKPSTYRDTERYLRVHWKEIARTPIQKITRADVAAGVAKIAQESGGVAANRARTALGSLFAWAIAEGRVDSSPVAGTRKAVEEKTRDRVLAENELKLIWEVAGEGDYGDIVRLLILTGQRREEVAAMAWDELDFEGEAWRIGQGRTKNSRPHDVPLTKPVMRILRARERREGRDLVFGRAGPFSGWSKAKAALDKRVANSNREPLASWTLHDIRRTVATRLADRGVLPHVIEAVLNHVSGHKAGVAGIYNRSTYAVEKREALVSWAAHFLDHEKG
jgi:integrase